jgi:adenylate cyclase
MTEIILDQRGTIDKYIGDCIMAFWNAPLDDAESAAHACRAALRMTKELDRINQSDTVRTLPNPAGSGPPRIKIGIGLNSGECNVGNMGSKQRFAYSAMGDAVNLAARLEGQSKYYCVNIVVGEQTADEAGEFATLELDLIRVSGKKQQVRIHALLGDEAFRSSAAFGALVAEQQAMLAAYRKMDWDAVDTAITRCRGHAAAADLELGGFYDLYSTRVTAYRAAPLPPDWDGVYVAVSK